nr:MAG: replication initiator protein [Microvirus sp.]
MRCTSPRTVGFYADGTTLCWSKHKYSKEFANFQLPCGKCIDCRLEYARQWAVRCIHEAQMHPKNSFITLTYSDEHLKPKLDYADFQLFMKKLRKTQNEPMGLFVTGEYGEKNKRPHWHAIIFNFRPSDIKPSRTTERGDQAYTSEMLEKLWGKGKTELGDVTFESAGYCARYASKKLVHGQDAEHDYQPISKKSSKHAIGKKWLEKYYESLFNYGELIINGRAAGAIPRYYLKWLKENKPDTWRRYVTETKAKFEELAIKKEKENLKDWIETNDRRLDRGNLTFTATQNEIRKVISKEKQKKLQDYLKL